MNLKRSGLMVAFAACGLSAGAASVDLVGQNITTNSFEYVFNSASDHVRIVDSSITTTSGNFTIKNSSGCLRSSLSTALTNVTITSAGAINLNAVQYTGNTNHVDILGGTFNATTGSSGLLFMGVSNPSASWGERVILRATDAVFNISGLRVGCALDAYFDGCSFSFGDTMPSLSGFGSGAQAPLLTFKDCFITNWTTRFARQSQTDPSKLIFDGGEIRFRRLDMSLYKGADAEVLFKGNADVKVVPTDAEMQAAQIVCELGDYRHFRMDVTDGATFGVRGDRENPTIQLGYDSEAKCEIHVSSGGVFNAAHATDGTGFFVYAGGFGSSEVYVEAGGEFDVYQYRMGGGGAVSGGALRPQIVRQTGGLFRTGAGKGVSDSKSSAVLMCFEAGHDCRYYLDGGVLQTPRISGSKHSGFVDGKGYSLLSANGGTIRPGYNSTNYHLFADLDCVEAGPGGLTVDVNNTAGATINQEVTNKKDDAGVAMKGVFRKIGAYTLTVSLPGRYDWDVSETRVEAGTLAFTGENVVLKTTMAVTCGGTLSLVGGNGAATSMTLDALTVDNGTIEIDPGDTIIVPAAKLNLKGLSFRYSSDPSVGDDRTVLITTGGRLSADAARSLKGAILANAIAEGAHTTVSLDYDEATQRTEVRMSVTNDAAPLADSTVWQGSSSDGWATDSNWSANVPTASKVATFSSPSAAKTVNVPAGATVGALAFGADGYELAGVENGALEIASDQGAARIETAVGESEISAPLVLDSMTAITNGPDTKLTVSESIDGAGFIKTGTGELELSTDNHIFRGVTIDGGRTRVRAEGSLGCDADKKPITLRAGTLTFDGEADAEMRIGNPIVVSTPGVRGATIVECKNDVVFSDYRTSVQGAFVKRGAGRLTIEVRDGQTLVGKLARTANTYFPMKEFVLDADGTAPDGANAAAGTHYYAEMSVLEGELLLKPAADAEGVPKVSAGEGMLTVGLRTSSGSVTPRLVLDGVDLDSTGDNSRCFAAGYLLYATGGITPFSTKPEVALLNGARLYATTLYCQSYGYGAGQSRLWAMTNATLQAKSAFWLNWNNVAAASQSQTGFVRFQVKDSAILHDGGNFMIDGGIQADFDNTFFGKTDRTGYATLKAYERDGEKKSGTWGTMLFRNGSVFKVNGLIFNDGWTPRNFEWSVFTLAFDDAQWDYGVNDFTLAASSVTEEYRPRFRIEMRGNGVKLAPPAGTTFTTELPFSGEGGLQVKGAGTVKFAAGTLKFSGTVDTGTGIVDLSEAGAVEKVSFAGPGTVKGASFGGGVAVKVESSDGQTIDSPITLADCTFAKTVVFDFGRTAANPMDERALRNGIVLANVTGKTGSFRVRFANTGVCDGAARVEIVDGKAVATGGLGLLLIVR